MSRTQHTPLEPAEDAVPGGATHRRAELEEQLLEAYSIGDGELVSRIREQLVALEEAAP